jgi:outer membrane protein
MSTFKFSRRAAQAACAFTLTMILGSMAAQSAPAPAAHPPAAAGTPDPRILVIDRNAILRGSKVGQSIMAQISGYTKSAESEFKAQGEALRKEGETLKQQIAILAPDVKAKKIRDFEAKEAAFQKKVQDRQDEVQGGLFKARQQVEQALGPILQGIMSERHANLLLDRNAVVLGTINVDVTGQAIQRLNQKLPTLKVELTPLPPEVRAQLEAQREQQGQ